MTFPSLLAFPRLVQADARVNAWLVACPVLLPRQFIDIIKTTLALSAELVDPEILRSTFRTDHECIARDFRDSPFDILPKWPDVSCKE